MSRARRHEHPVSTPWMTALVLVVAGCSGQIDGEPLRSGAFNFGHDAQLSFGQRCAATMIEAHKL